MPLEVLHAWQVISDSRVPECRVRGRGARAINRTIEESSFAMERHGLLIVGGKSRRRCTELHTGQELMTCV